jgi:RES domain/HEPN/RES N-terminal domain 1
LAALCWRCAEDEHLQRIIRENGRPELCSECDGEIENAYDADDLAQVLDPILREHFRIGEMVRKFGEDDKDWYEQEGDPLPHHIQEVIGQFLGWEDDIVSALVQREDVDERDGEQPFYDDSQEYVPTEVRSYSLRAEWDNLCEDLKHRRRYFSSLAAAFFKDLFSDVELRSWWGTETRADEKVAYEIPEGTELFRARIFNSRESVAEAYRDPMKHVGPPPSTKARAGRMNADGVSVFYSALDPETCSAETRPAIGADVVAIKVKLTKPIHVLDFCRLGKSYRSLSYFQPNFSRQVEKGDFLQRLQRLISEPIIPGREAEYLITQTMAEYLASVHDPPFEGIVFDAAQRRNGVNVVLFPDLKGGFPLEYVNESVTLYSVDSIEYRQHKVDIHVFDNEIFIYDPRDEPEDY